jgi:NHLM bacteriocin system ABC transporter peptidase/ATP-binding protein
MEAVECGAAALAIVLAYHGRIVPLEELRIACGVSRDGSKASNIVKAARTYGLTPRAFKKEPEDLRKLALPAIIFWEFNHFVVLEGFRNGRVYLNDPASGPRHVSDEEFDGSFTGVVITFEVTPDFKRGGERPSLLRALGERLRGSRLDLLYVVAVGLALVVPGIVLPSFTRIFLDQILVQGEQSWLRPLLLCMGGVIAIQAALTWLQQNYLMRLETKLALQSSSRFFWHVLSLPIEFFAQRHGGEIATRVAINDRVASLLSGQLAASLLGCFTAVFYLFLLLQYDWVLTILGVTVAAANALLLVSVSRFRKDGNMRVLQESGKLSGITIGGLRNIETLKASGSEDSFFTRWAGHHAKALVVKQQLATFDQFLFAIPALLVAINTAAILVIGGFRVMDGHLTIGTLVAFQTLMASFLAPISTLVNLGGSLQQTEGDLGRLDDVLRYESAPYLSDEKAADSPLAGKPRLSGRIEFRNVTFGYSRLEPPLIKDFNLEILPGQRVALIGRTGSGKSTLSKLASGLYEPWSGEILFDGVPRPLVPRHLFVTSLGVVDQDIFLFSGTIRENLTMWDRDIPVQRVVRAAWDAEIHDMISVRQGAYEAEISEGGGNFSGGQQQRLEIARALVGDPSILILDEATSALDPSTEEAITANLRTRGCTCLIVAHRLSTIRDADQIVVLEQGTIVERGKHKDLITAGGPYARLMQ